MTARLVLSLVGTTLLVGACSNGASESAPYKYTDAKGRHCSHKSYLLASCDADPAPMTACTPSNHACFVVYIGPIERVDAGAADATPSSLMFNCEACCKDGSSAWTGVSTDCTNIVCASDQDCAGDRGVCDDGRCRLKPAP